ncbi:MAG: MFS transporter [Alphaproteobacteria bacterium]|nr:MFS transporter [Alphaproteobacteria bacterium]
MAPTGPRRAGVRPISDIQPERSSRLRGVFAPFAVRSFRFQWPGDLATSLAFEMETLILNWFVLVTTGSVMLQTAFAALQFLGTLVAPAIGSLGDRLGRRAMIAAMRGFYLLLAGCLAALGLTDRLDPTAVFAIAALAGLVRPSDLVMRNALVGDTMADRLLVSAMGFSRTTQDLARIAGALIGATLFQSLGIGPAYLVVGAFYLAAFGLSFGVGGRRARARRRGLSVPAELRAGYRHIRRTPALMAGMWLDFLVNFTGYPVTSGLMPFAAREVYGLDAVGLSHLLASYAAGAFIGSFVMAVGGGPRRSPVGAVFAGVFLWYLLLAVFSQMVEKWAGMAVLVALGTVQGGAMIGLAVFLLRRSNPRLRGMVMGVRMLMVYGMAVGLPLGGVLIETVGYRATVLSYAFVGLAGTALIAFRWRRALFGAEAAGRPSRIAAG